MQVIKTFGIRDIFCEAIKSCSDIEPSNFPFLSKNKSSGAGNVSKITRALHHHIMIYVARMYVATEMMKKLNPNYEVSSFDFHSFPYMEAVFRSIENHLSRRVTGYCIVKIEKDRNKKASILLENIRTSILDCKNCLASVTGWLADTEDKVKLVEKKVKGLEKDKRSKELSKLMAELVEMKKNKEK